MPAVPFGHLFFDMADGEPRADVRQRARHVRLSDGVKRFLGSLAVIVVGAGLATACTAYDRDQYASLLTASARTDGGIGNDGSGDEDATTSDKDAEGQPGVDAGVDAPEGGDGTCGASSQQGSWVTIERPGGTAPPTTGGVIVAGTYVLTGYRGYANAPVEDGQVRETIEVTVANKGGVFARLVERTSTSGNIAPIGFEQSFDPGADPDTLKTNILCSDNDATGKDVVYYDATSTSFALVSADVVREYTRRP